MTTEEYMIKGLVPVKRSLVTLLMESGYLYMEMNKPTEAQEVFEGVAALVPHSSVPHMGLGHLHFSFGRLPEALKAHQKACDIEPDSAAAHAGVGEILMFLREFEQAEEQLDLAIALDNDGPAAEFARMLLETRTLGVFG